MMQNAISCLLLGIHVHMVSSFLGIHIYMASSVLGIHIMYMASSVLVRNTAVFTLVYTSTWPPQFWCGKQLSLPWCTHLLGHLSSGVENSCLHLGVHIYLATSVLVQKTAVFTLVYTSTWPTLFWCGKQLSSPWHTQLPGQLSSGAENSCLHLGIHIYIANSVLGIHIYMASSVLGIHIYLASSVLGIHIYLASSVLGIHIYLASSVPGIHIYLASSVLGIHIYLASSVLGIHIYLASSVPGIHIYLASSVVVMTTAVFTLPLVYTLPGQLSCEEEYSCLHLGIHITWPAQL